MESCTIAIKLKPNAKKNQITVSQTGNIEISVTSPPVDNKANQHLVRLLSEHLDVPKTSLEIIRGEHCRNKVVAIEGMSKEVLMKRLQQ